jgi:aspartate/methionine/tyrosine aminotransferase
MASAHQRISARVSAITESATLAVDAKARAAKAAGRPVIGFGVGEPDFPTPGYIVAAAQRACAEPRMQKYSPAAGLPELREAIAAKTARDSGYRVTPGQVLVTNGGKQGVYQAFATLLDPGDEVLVPTPYWTTYPEAIALAGGIPVPVLTDEHSGYLTSVADLAAHLTERTKVLLFVSPSNPTGAVYRRNSSPRSGAGPRPTISGSSPTRSTSTWSTGGQVQLDPGGRAGGRRAVRGGERVAGPTR